MWQWASQAPGGGTYFGLTGFGSGPAMNLVIGADGYCFSIFARSMTTFHLAISETSSSRSPSGVLPRASMPSPFSRSFTSDEVTAALISRLSLSTIALGVLAGAATPRTPRAIVDRLNLEINAAVTSSDVKLRLKGLGIDARGSTPEGLRELLVSEIAKWKVVIERAKIEKQ